MSRIDCTIAFMKQPDPGPITPYETSWHHGGPLPNCLSRVSLVKLKTTLGFGNNQTYTGSFPE